MPDSVLELGTWISSRALLTADVLLDPFVLANEEYHSALTLHLFRSPN